MFYLLIEQRKAKEGGGLRTKIMPTFASELNLGIISSLLPFFLEHLDAVQLTLEQIDVIRRLTEKYSNALEWVTTARGKSFLGSHFPRLKLIRKGKGESPFVWEQSA